MRYVRNLFVSLAVIFAIVLGFSTCAKQPEEVKIGALLALTGPAAEWGQNEYQGLQIAVEELNATIPQNERKFRIALEDSKSDPKEAVTAFNKMLAVDNPNVILTIQSGVSMAVAPIANQNKKILICSAAAPDLVKVSNYIFRCFPTSNQLAEALTSSATQKLGINEIYIFYINNDYGKSMRDVFAHRFASVGGKIVGEDTYDEKQMDFRPQIAKILAKRPRAIFVPGSGTALGLFLKQLKENRYRGTILTTLEVSYNDVLKAASDAANGVIYADMPFDPQSQDQEMQKFVSTFKEKFGKEPILDALIGYDVGRMVIDVMKTVGNDPEKIREGLSNVKGFKGLLGNLKMSPSREIEYSLILKTITDGKVVAYAQ